MPRQTPGKHHHPDKERVDSCILLPPPDRQPGISPFTSLQHPASAPPQSTPSLPLRVATKASRHVARAFFFASFLLALPTGVARARLSYATASPPPPASQPVRQPFDLLGLSPPGGVLPESHLLSPRFAMATNGAPEAFTPSDVLGAVLTMRGGEQETKKKAHEYLERFQKSVCRILDGVLSLSTNLCYDRRIPGAPSSVFSSPRLRQRPLYLQPSPCEERLRFRVLQAGLYS